jgi:hypothetical protein
MGKIAMARAYRFLFFPPFFFPPFFFFAMVTPLPLPLMATSSVTSMHENNE